MKKWESELRQKLHTDRLKTVRPAVDTRRPPLYSPKQVPNSNESTHSIRALLKEYGLMQYYRKLTEEGYGTHYKRLATLTEKQVTDLFTRLNLLPGHSARFKDMIHSFRKPLHHNRIQSAIPPRSTTPYHFTQSQARHLGTIVIRPSFLEIDSSSDSDPDLETLQENMLLAKKHLSLLTSDLNNSVHISKMSSLSSTDSSSSSLQILKHKSAVFEECPINKNLSRQDLGSSYDSSKMRSTLAHLDIEEISRCLSKAIIHHISQNLPSPSLLPNGMLKRLEQVFIDTSTGNHPNEISIYNFMKNVLIRSRMEKEVSVICLVYIEKLVEKTGLKIEANNWKRVLLIAMILASKVWDDESFENKHFASVLTQFPIKEINEMESAFLTMIDFEVFVTQKDYAQAYFTLRTYADSKFRSFPLQALDVESVLRLQSSSRKVGESLRQSHGNNLFRTL